MAGKEIIRRQQLEVKSGTGLVIELKTMQENLNNFNSFIIEENEIRSKTPKDRRMKKTPETVERLIKTILYNDNVYVFQEKLLEYGVVKKGNPDYDRILISNMTIIKTMSEWLTNNKGAMIRLSNGKEYSGMFLEIHKIIESGSSEEIVDRLLHPPIKNYNYLLEDLTNIHEKEKKVNLIYFPEELIMIPLLKVVKEI